MRRCWEGLNLAPTFLVITCPIDALVLRFCCSLFQKATAADIEFVRTAPNADPVQEGKNFTPPNNKYKGPDGGIGGVSASGDHFPSPEQSGEKSDHDGKTGERTEEEEERILPGHARAWFSLPGDGVIDSYLLLMYLRQVLLADSLMRVLHCAAPQRQPIPMQQPPKVEHRAKEGQQVRNVLATAGGGRSTC